MLVAVALARLLLVASLVSPSTASLRHGVLRGGGAALDQDNACKFTTSKARVLPVALGTLPHLRSAKLEHWEEAARELARAPSLGSLRLQQGPFPCRAVFSLKALVQLVADSHRAAREVVRSRWVGGGFVDAKAAGGQPASAESLTGPFLARKRLPAGAHVAFFGDLHGDLAAFVAELRILRNENIIDSSLGVVGDNLLVLCGDLVDRGRAPLEVLALALTLRLLNPSRVLLVRGNHEDLRMLDKYGTTMAADVKFGGHDTLGQRVNIKSVGKQSTILEQISLAFDTFPVAAFITVGASTHWAMAMHGAFEPSVNVAGFLADTASPDGFAAIGAPGSGVSALRYDLWAQEYFSGRNAPPRPANVPQPARAQQLDADKAPTWARLDEAQGPSLGFQWGDFFARFDMPAEPAMGAARGVLQYTPKRGYQITQKLTREWMAVRHAARVGSTPPPPLTHTHAHPHRAPTPARAPRLRKSRPADTIAPNSLHTQRPSTPFLPTTPPPPPLYSGKHRRRHIPRAPARRRVAHPTESARRRR